MRSGVTNRLSLAGDHRGRPDESPGQQEEPRTDDYGDEIQGAQRRTRGRDWSPPIAE